MIGLIFIGLAIWSFIYCIRKKGIIGFLLWLLLPVIGILIVMLLPSDKDKEREKPRKTRTFYCNLCYYTYPEYQLGAKSDR
ncbi:MAG: hypothetical protein mread185_000304 [Mycoplasmataceae bacterium]|nr:MAG: hypothetical protein mread185_000304 [Mycoplasmataceae bacterium]